MITCLYNEFWIGFHKALIWLSDILSISGWKGLIIRLASNSLKNPTYIVLSYISTRPWNWEIAIMVKVLVFGWHRSPLRSGFVSQSVSQSGSQSLCPQLFTMFPLEDLYDTYTVYVSRQYLATCKRSRS